MFSVRYYGNLEWQFVLLDYSLSMGLYSYNGNPVTRNGWFNTTLQRCIAFVLSIVKVLSCWFYISGTYLLIMISWKVFCRIISQVVCPRFPEHEKLYLFDAIYDPIENHVNVVWATLFGVTICDAYCRCILWDDGSGQWGVLHFNSWGLDWYCFFSVCKQSTKFGFHGQWHYAAHDV